jgi:hypothetical protein
MRERNVPLPSREESKKETDLRLKILDSILPELKSFAVAAVLGGSVAYGKNYSVRKESDIDLIILIERQDVDKIRKVSLFNFLPQTEEAVIFFKNKEVDHFSILGKLKGVEIQYHFWDKEAHFKAERMQDPQPKWYNIFKMENAPFSGVDFEGKTHYFISQDVKVCKYGLIQQYPSYFIDNGVFIPRQPLLNLICAPEILFTKDKQLLKNIDLIWENLVKRLIVESNGEIDLNKKSIIKSFYGYWNLSKESQKKLEKRQDEEITKWRDKI